MSLHQNRTRTRRRAAVIGGSLAAVAATTGAAWAAVQLFGFGQADVAATTAQHLTVDNIDATAPLYPGVTVGAKGVVHNPNPFPITVTGVIIRAEELHGTGTGCNENTLHPKGTFGDYGTGIGHGWKTTLATPVTVAAGGAEWVTLPQAVSQDPAATAFCGFTAKIAVTAQTGN